MSRLRTLARPRASRAIAVSVATALTAALAACGSDADDASVGASDAAAAVDSVVDGAEELSDELADALRENGLENIAGIVGQVDMSEVIDGEFTFFAPDDDAFTTLGADRTADLLTDPSRILDVLRNHTLSDTVTASELAAMDAIDTETGATIPVTTEGDGVRLGDVVVVTTDIEVGDGVVHVVDGFLVP